MASPNAGGFVYLTIDGVQYSPVGEVEIEPTNVEVESLTNQDGTISRSVKPKPYKIMVTIRDRKGLDINTIMLAERVDVSARERHMQRTVFLTGGFATGTVKRNTQNGEISGIEICGDTMRIVDNQV